jgi:alcohol dehydrogenase class IV
MEAYVSRKNNPFSDQQSLHALKAIGANLVDACNEPHNHKAREAMMLASTNAGIAFSNSSVTIIHGMSRPIGARFHVPHGMSNAMLCPILTEFSIPGAVPRYAEVSRTLGMCDVGVSDEDAAAALPAGLQDLCTNLQVPTFQEFGIEADQFRDLTTSMASAALASGSPNNNPVIPTQEEVEGLYQKIWNSGSK